MPTCRYNPGDQSRWAHGVGTWRGGTWGKHREEVTTALKSVPQLSFHRLSLRLSHHGGLAAGSLDREAGAREAANMAGPHPHHPK